MSPARSRSGPPHAGRPAGDLAIDPVVGRDHPPFVEGRASPLPPRPAQPLAQVPILGEAEDLGGQRVGVAGGREEAGLALHDDLGDAADAGGHHGEAGGHPLDQGQGDPLAPARQQHGIGRPEQPGHVGAGAEPEHVVPQAQAANQLVDRARLRPVPDDDQPDVAPTLGHPPARPGRPWRGP